MLNARCKTTVNNLTILDLPPAQTTFQMFCRMVLLCSLTSAKPLNNLRGGGRKVGGGISLNNFLRSSCFNIELSLPPRCLSISCIHFASYVDFPHWPLHHFLCFCCCNIRTSPASTTSCMHLVSISKFHPPCAIVINKNHKQDNVSQFAGQLCELEGPRCLNRWTLGWGTLRVGIGF